MVAAPLPAKFSMCAMTSASGTGMLRVQMVLCILYILPFAAVLCEGWRSFSGGVCQAPQSYGGVMCCFHSCVRAAFQHMASIGACASMQSFASWATLDKLKYSESCSAPWPCQGEFRHRVLSCWFLFCLGFIAVPSFLPHLFLVSQVIVPREGITTARAQ